MRSVEKEITIDASPEKVFDLVSRVEEFSTYSKYIREIKEIAPGTYLWKMDLLGLSLEWEAVVTECERPVRFAWRSTSGVYNAGSYLLEPKGDATRVTFRMEYRLGGLGLEKIIAPFLGRVMSEISNELLEKIKDKLERD